jgi:hypothetical protein
MVILKARYLEEWMLLSRIAENLHFWNNYFFLSKVHSKEKNEWHAPISILRNNIICWNEANFCKFCSKKLIKNVTFNVTETHNQTRKKQTFFCFPNYFSKSLTTLTLIAVVANCRNFSLEVSFWLGMSGMLTL